jgi:uncharacterized cupin superfamily protein
MTGTEPSARHGVFARLDSVFLKPAPIEPSWILSGSPVARSGVHSKSADGCASTNVWDCSAGIFNWYFGWDETVVILEGSVKVTSPDGITTELNVGDIGYFPARTQWRWEVERYVRKIAFNRRAATRSEILIRTIRQKLGVHRRILKVGVGIVTAAIAACATLLLAD